MSKNGENVRVSVAADFSAFPSGRTNDDDEFNGTRFRQTVLMPGLERAISQGVKLVVSIDGVKSFGSSFFDEAFAGLVKNGYYTAQQLNSVMEIEAGTVGYQRYRDAIWKYIKEAKAQT